jgi:hypothetical protein
MMFLVNTVFMDHVVIRSYRMTVEDDPMLMRSSISSMSEHDDEGWSGMVSSWRSAVGL